MLGPERMEEDLRIWKERLDRIWEGEPTDTLDMALADAKKRYPDLSIEPYNDMIDGMLMDTPGHRLFQDRYETWDELYTRVGRAFDESRRGWIVRGDGSR